MKKSLEELEKEAAEAATDLYKSGILRGLEYALDQLHGGIKDAIRMGLEANSKGESVTQTQIDSIYKQWAVMMRKRNQ